MKERTGKECAKTNCVNYKYYSNWLHNLNNPALNICMNCKYAHVSQYVKEVSNGHS